MRFSPESSPHHGADGLAAVFVDYDNLYTYLYGYSIARSRPDEIIHELVRNLKQFLSDERHITVAQITAYADFSGMHKNGQHIQQGLYLHGIEPRFVPGSMQRNAAEIQLCVDAVETLSNRRDVGSIVIVSGDRLYLPLVQHCLRRGMQPVIASFTPPSSSSRLAEEGVFLAASDFLDDSFRRQLSSPPPPQRTVTQDVSAARERRSKTSVEYRDVEIQGARHALEIIDEHFGQYEEIYLTPLLRKLSELLDDSHHDPKSLISELESAGAVWLEKRRGFPHDYTVLLIDPEHPDVEAIQKQAGDAPPYPEDSQFDEEYEASSETYEEELDNEGFDEEYDEEYAEQSDAYSGTDRDGDDSY